jgi:hypothetical protein
MALIAITLDRKLRSIMLALPAERRLVALRGAHPQMAQAVEGLATPGFSRKLNVETLAEALSYTEDAEVLDTVLANDRRHGAEAAVWARRRQLSDRDGPSPRNPAERVAQLVAATDEGRLDGYIPGLLSNPDAYESAGLTAWYRTLDPTLKERLMGTLCRAESRELRRAILDDIVEQVIPTPMGTSVSTRLMRDYDEPITGPVARWLVKTPASKELADIFRTCPLDDDGRQAVFEAKRWDLLLHAGVSAEDVRDAALQSADPQAWTQALRVANGSQCDVLFPPMVAALAAGVTGQRLEAWNHVASEVAKRPGVSKDTVACALRCMTGPSIVEVLCAGSFQWSNDELGELFSSARHEPWATSGGAILLSLTGYDRTPPAIELAEVLLEFGGEIFSHPLPPSSWVCELTSARIDAALGDDEQAWAVFTGLMNGHQGSLDALLANVSAVLV